MKEWDLAPPRIVRAPVHCLLKPHTGCVSAGQTQPSGWGMLFQPVINQTAVAGGIIVLCLALRAARLISPGETRVSINITKHNAGWTSETARGSAVCAAAVAGCRKKQGSVLATEWCNLEKSNLLTIYLQKYEYISHLVAILVSESKVFLVFVCFVS